MMKKMKNAPRARRYLDAGDAARTLWLASLGAVSLAQKQGGKLIETLVAEGEDFRSRTGKLAVAVKRDIVRAANDAQSQIEGAIGPIKARAISTVRTVEAGVNDRFSDVLGRFGVARKVTRKPKATRSVKRVVRRTKAKAAGRRRAA
jgi:poly(hydroxyalkanoate) granule-associated protein